MKIELNGKPHDARAEQRVEELVAEFAGTTKAAGLAVAVNETVISRESWPQQILQAGDRVEILGIVGGG